MRIPARIRQQSTDWVLQFINIVFLLLLYFIVNGSIVEQQRLQVELPVTTSAQAGLPPRGAIYIDRNGAMSLAGEALALPDIAARLQANGGLGSVTVAADRLLPAASLLKVLDVLKSNGAGEMTIITITGPPG